MRWASVALMVAGLLALAAFWCLTQHGAAHLTLGSPASGTDFALDLHATGVRALVALGAAGLAVLLFIFGFVRAISHFGRPAASPAAPPEALITAPSAAVATAPSAPPPDGGSEG